MKSCNRRQFISFSTMSPMIISAFIQRQKTLANPSTSQRRYYSNLSCGRIGAKASFEESVDLATRHGFEAVDPDPGYFSKLSQQKLDALLSQLEKAKLKFGSAGLPVDFRGSEAAFQEGLKKLPKYAEELGRIKITRVATWILSFSNDYTYLEYFRLHRDRLRNCASILGDHGIRLGLEYVGPKTAWRSSKHPFIHTLSETLELIEAINQKNVGLQLDSWHWFNAEETEAGLAKLKNEQVVAVDINDAPAGVPLDRQVDSSRELPLSTGVIPLASFMKALRAIGYDGPISIEPFNATLRAMPLEQACATTAAAMHKVMEL
jgi:sugar phosphate isomerase/epimerase